MRSPLGKYSALAAAIAAIGILGAYVLSIFLEGIGVLHPGSGTGLKDLALIAAGAVFASGAVATNGAAAMLDRDAALHARLDAAGLPAAATTHPHPPA